MILLSVHQLDRIDPAWGIPLGIILWVVFVLIVLVSLRRAKIKRDKIRRAKLRAARRESFIQIEQEKEQAYIDSINAMPIRDHMASDKLARNPKSIKKLSKQKNDRNVR